MCLRWLHTHSLSSDKKKQHITVQDASFFVLFVVVYHYLYQMTANDLHHQFISL